MRSWLLTATAAAILGGAGCNSGQQAPKELTVEEERVLEDSRAKDRVQEGRHRAAKKWPARGPHQVRPASAGTGVDAAVHRKSGTSGK